VALAATDATNAPNTLLEAGLAGLMALDADRAAAGLAGLVATGRHGRMYDLDLRLLRAGLQGLAGRQPEALREGRAVLAEYERLGLPFRQALGSLALITAAGGDDAEIRDLADGARAIFDRLGAAPFVARLDAALARAVTAAS
jgi:hypothetical protein